MDQNVPRLPRSTEEYSVGSFHCDCNNKDKERNRLAQVRVVH